MIKEKLNLLKQSIIKLIIYNRIRYEFANTRLSTKVAELRADVA